MTKRNHLKTNIYATSMKAFITGVTEDPTPEYVGIPSKRKGDASLNVRPLPSLGLISMGYHFGCIVEREAPCGARRSYASRREHTRASTITSIYALENLHMDAITCSPSSSGTQEG